MNDTRSDRRRLLKGLGAAAATALVPAWARAGGASPSTPTDALVIDALASPLGQRRERGALIGNEELAQLMASGLAALHLSAGPVGREEGAWDATREALERWRREVQARPRHLLHVQGPGDMRRARDTGRVGLVLGMQDAVALEGDATRLDVLRGAGLRVVQLTYNGRNRVGDGCLVEDDRGLSGFGREVLARAEDQRLLVDLSHSSERTCLDALQAARRPLAITHTGCMALARNPRNKTDAELRALAERGGVVGIYFMPFLREEGQPHAVDVIRHVEHAIDVCGEDHVGIGTDGQVGAIDVDEEYRRRFAETIRMRREAGISAPGEREDVFIFVPDLNAPSRYRMLARMLARRGHSGQRIDKVLGMNMLRVMEQALA
ncbi:dipeptidase [Alkalisalibacterium limincola]|uniref:Peptidase M19 n=1 Tax=Alkalisalibacterium limincola TaxID=2699169 RepID=A0A5C8KXS6_9GAMM|nr:membrane dipeptidase [Alkalisalibacterium limincola]TXK64874.1 peptidase M19 [Alkalisalibacterium limincola]